MASKDPHNEQSEEERDGSIASPASILSSPDTPTNKPDSTSLIPKRETNDPQMTLMGSPSNRDQGIQNDGRLGAGVYGPSSSSAQQLHASMLLPPYMADMKGPQVTPESISLSNYVKLMTLQQQQGGGGGGPSRYPMPPGPFHPTAGIFPDSQSSELASVVTPTTHPPQYDVNYHHLLVNQAQQLGSLTAGFQHPLAKPGQVPGQGIKDDKHSMMGYQHGNPSGSYRTSPPQGVRRRTKRSHGQSIDQEEEAAVDPTLERGSVFPSEGEGSREDRRPLSLDMGERLPHQLKWRAHMVETWHGMCDAALIDLPNVGFHVETDKGFNFSIIDDSFVCQKKNHFQVTATVFFHGIPKFVKMKNGSIQPIEKFSLNLHGIRFEQINSHIQLEQSRSDRSKIRYTPDSIEIPDNPEKPLKRTICRLHFSETTQNNMRKRGKPNPDQKHFSLVVALHAETPEGSLPIVAHVSERIVVRASNPGNFDNDSDYLWYRCSNSDNIFHHGHVGINTDKPEEALTVVGNIHVTGQVLQISDSRVKKNILPVESRPHLDNISRLKLYYYQLNTEHSPSPTEEEDMPTSESSRTQVGLLAQEVREVLPEAVLETKAEASLGSGGRVRNVLMVDKDQVLMETIGAVQELKTVTSKLSAQVSTLEEARAQSCKYFTQQTCQSNINTALFALLIVMFALFLLF